MFELQQQEVDRAFPVRASDVTINYAFSSLVRQGRFRRLSSTRTCMCRCNRSYNGDAMTFHRRWRYATSGDIRRTPRAGRRPSCHQLALVILGSDHRRREPSEEHRWATRADNETANAVQPTNPFRLKIDFQGVARHLATKTKTKTSLYDAAAWWRRSKTSHVAVCDVTDCPDQERVARIRTERRANCGRNGRRWASGTIYD